MLETFDCPHCNNSYPILPTLVGRKVRCTHCKLAFQLQYDGIAIKINTGKKVEKERLAEDSSPALEVLPSKKTGTGVGPADRGVDGTALEPAELTELAKPSARVLGNRGAEKKSTVGVRPQTKALRRHTERIKKIRSSLQGAAQQALDGIEQGVDPGDAVDTPTRQSTGAAKPGLSAVRLTGHGYKQRRLNIRIMLGVFVSIVLFLLMPFVFTDKAERAGLNNFTADLTTAESVHPTREHVYRGRMWIYTRDGKLSPPMVLNVDRASSGDVQSVDWPALIATCSPDLDGMVLSRRFALWYKIGEQEQLEQLWASCPSKMNSEGFFKYLMQSKFAYFRADALPALLLKRGASKQACYVLSSLLAGTQDQHGKPCQDFGLSGDVIPSRLQWCEFVGQNGNLLQDEGGLYGAATAKEYCGLLVGFAGFSGIDEQRADEWRILDMRLAPDMAAFYAARHNPLQLMSEHAFELLRIEARKQADGELAGSLDQPEAAQE